MSHHYRRLYSAQPRVDTNLTTSRSSPQKNKYDVRRGCRYKSPPKHSFMETPIKETEKNKETVDKQVAKLAVNRSAQTHKFGYNPIDKKSIRFLRDITDDALKKGAYTDFTLERIFIKHDKKNKYNLEKILRDKELDKLRRELGMPSKIDDRKENRNSPSDFEAVEALNSLVLNPKTRNSVLNSLGIVSVGENVVLPEGNKREVEVMVHAEDVETDEKDVSQEKPIHVSVRSKDIVSPEISDEEVEDISNSSSQGKPIHVSVRSKGISPVISDEEVVEEISNSSDEDKIEIKNTIKQVENSYKRIKTVLGVINEEKASSVKSDETEDLTDISSEDEIEEKVTTDNKSVRVIADKLEAKQSESVSKEIDKTDVISEPESYEEESSDESVEEVIDDDSKSSDNSKTKEIVNNDKETDSKIQKKTQPDTTSELSSIHTELS